MNTEKCKRTPRRKAPPRRSCEVELTGLRTATGADGYRLSNGLTQLEYEALSLPADEKIVRQDRFPLLLGVTPAEVSVVLNRLRRLGLIERERFLVKDPAPWVWLTIAGCHVAHLSEGMRYKPSVGQLDHADAVVRARIAYMRKYPKALWVPERELSRRHDRKKRHLVDGLVELPVKGGTKVVALEVELTQKLSTRRVRIVSSLCTDPDYSEIHYLCSTLSKTEVIHAMEAVEKKGIDVDNLKILDLPDLAGIA